MAKRIPVKSGQRFEEGDVVWLCAFENEPEEKAVVIEDQRPKWKCILVEVMVRNDDYDDGLREVGPSQIIAVEK